MYGRLTLATLVTSAAFIGVRRIDGAASRLFGVADDGAVPASIATSSSAIAAFTAVFFVPSLVLRYWGHSRSAQVLGLILVVAGALIGIVREARVRRPNAVGVARWIFGAGIALFVGIVASTTDALGFLGQDAGAPEELLLRKALLLALPALITWRIVERIYEAIDPRAPA